MRPGGCKKLVFYNTLSKDINSSKILEKLLNKKQYKHLKPSATVDLQYQKVQ